MNNWIRTTIGEQVTLQRGFDITKSEQREGKVPVISSGGISSYHDTSQLRGPGVILGRKGVVGSVYYIETEYWPHDTTLWVKDFHGNHPRFVYYFFRNFAPRLAKLDVGSANPTLNRNHVHPTEILWPSLPIQQTIAQILGSLDDKIEVNRHINETLEAMARVIFQSWFVDFDHVRAKMEGWDTGMPLEIAELFPDGFEEVEGLEVPRGWGVKLLSDSFDVRMGQSPPGTTYNENGEGISFFQGRTDFGFRYPSVRVYCTAPTRFAEIGDTLVSVRAPVGDINLTKERCCIGRGVAAVRHKTGSRSFTYYQMLSFKDIFALFESEGTVFGSINKTDFNSIECITPPENIVTKFEEIIFPLDQMIENNERLSRTLAQIRDALLPKLMSGKIKISA
jgi:type I restriction enzyme S subunit